VTLPIAFPTSLIAVPRPGQSTLLLASGAVADAGNFVSGALFSFNAEAGSALTTTVLDQPPLTLTAGDLFGDGGTEVLVLEATQVAILISDGSGSFRDGGIVPLPVGGEFSIDFGAQACGDQADLLMANDSVDGGGQDIVVFCTGGSQPVLTEAFGPRYASFDTPTTNLCPGVNSVSVGGVGENAQFAFNCPNPIPDSSQFQADPQVDPTNSVGVADYGVFSGFLNSYPSAMTYFKDLNGDGVPDLLTLDADPSHGGISVGYCQEDGLGLIDGDGGLVTLPQPWPLGYAGAAFGDLNGDGRTDIAIFGYDTGPSVYSDGGPLLGTRLYPDGGMAGGTDTFLEAMTSLPDGGLSTPVLFDLSVLSQEVGYPQNAPGPGVAVGDFLGLGVDQIAVLDTGGNIRIFQAVCQ
jgi:hypothetical protein